MKVKISVQVVKGEYSTDEDSIAFAAAYHRSNLRKFEKSVSKDVKCDVRIGIMGLKDGPEALAKWDKKFEAEKESFFDDLIDACKKKMKIFPPPEWVRVYLQK
jgi:hypothetical protein